MRHSDLNIFDLELSIAHRGPQKLNSMVIRVSRSTEIFSKRRKIYSMIETRPD